MYRTYERSGLNGDMSGRNIVSTSTVINNDTENASSLASMYHYNNLIA